MIRGYAANNSRALDRRRSSTTDYVNLGRDQETFSQVIIIHYRILSTDSKTNFRTCIKWKRVRWRRMELIRQLVKINMKMIRTVTLTWIMVSERNLLVRKDEIN